MGRRGVPGAVVAGGAALGVLVIVLAAASRGGPRSALPPAAAFGVTVPRGAAAVRLPARAKAIEVAPPANVPASLEGTEPDGAITADAAGHLVIDLELRRLFDHFLAATGEEPIAVIRARIIAVLRARLPAAAAAEAIALLDRYLGYRNAARGLTAPASPAAGLAQIHDLRVTWLSAAVAKALFGSEEASIYAALARRDIAADPALSEAERARRLAALEAARPTADRAARAAATAPLDEMNREAAMRAAGASDDQLSAARTAALGAEAAARLAALDRAHAAWDARLGRYRAERAALQADGALDDAERSRRIAALQARSFSAAEQLRVAALDRLAADPAAASPR